MAGVLAASSRPYLASSGINLRRHLSFDDAMHLVKLIVTALTAIAMGSIYVGAWERRIEREPTVMQPVNFEQQEYLRYLESIGDRECY